MKRGLCLTWLHTLDTWSVVYAGGTFIRCLLVSLCTISSLSWHPLFPWDTSHMVQVGMISFPSHGYVWVWTRPGYLGHHICQVAMVGLGTGSWLNLRAIIILPEDFLSGLLEKTISFCWSCWELWASSGHLAYYVERAHPRDRAVIWVPVSSFDWTWTNTCSKKDRKNKNAYQSWSSMASWYWFLYVVQLWALL